MMFHVLVFFFSPSPGRAKNVICTRTNQSFVLFLRIAEDVDTWGWGPDKSTRDFIDLTLDVWLSSTMVLERSQLSWRRNERLGKTAIPLLLITTLRSSSRASHLTRATATCRQRKKKNLSQLVSGDQLRVVADGLSAVNQAPIAEHHKVQVWICSLLFS